MAENIMGRLKRWAQRLTAPDQIDEPGMDSLDDTTASILENGTKKAGEGIFPEEKGFTPKDNSAIVFVDPRLLDDEKEPTAAQTKATRVQTKKAVDDDTFEDLEKEEAELDNKERGFRFHKDSILDMRMDKNSKLTAHYVVNNYSYKDLVNILYKYGEEKYAKNIANAIIKYREEKNIDTTLELVEIIKSSVPIKYTKDHHPARKTFQAIRIEVNNELEVFESALKDALDLLNIGGRVCVITFHSLEDKICKEIFKEKSSVRKEFKNMPIIPLEYEPKFKIIANISPEEDEILENNRSRSSRLRVIERIR